MFLGAQPSPIPMLDEQLRALAHPLRRRLLVALLDHNPQKDTIDSTSVHQGDWPLEVLQSEMYHSHLPKLEEVGFIEWHQDTHEVVKGPRFDEIRPLLELIDAHADELPADWP